MFYADIEGHPTDRMVARSRSRSCRSSRSEMKVLGTYPASPYRAEAARLAAEGKIPVRRRR